MVAGGPPPILERRRRAGRGDRVAPNELIIFDLDRATLARRGRREGREVRFLCPEQEVERRGWCFREARVGAPGET